MGVSSKRVEEIDTRRVHRRNVQKGDVVVHSRLGIYITALTRILSTI